MVAAVRLRRLQAESEATIVLDWRSFLLRPQPSPQPRSLEQFRAYTESWRRCLAEEPQAPFRVWSTDEGPPTHSLPPHLVAKAAATLGVQAFEAVHQALLTAYFTDNHDISDEGVLRALWRRCGLQDDDFRRCRDPLILDRVVAEHREALEHGASGVPAVRSAGGFGVVVGAQPLEAYRRWIERLESPP